MNRAQRRRRQRREWADGIEAVQRQSDGILDIRHFSPADPAELARIIVAAGFGSPEANALLLAIERTLQHVATAPTDRPALCGCCDAKIRATPFVIVLATPHGRPVGDAASLATTLCRDCQSDVPKNAAAAFKNVWSDARIIAIHDPPETVQ
jgi:hypothetical protein